VRRLPWLPPLLVALVLSIVIQSSSPHVGATPPPSPTPVPVLSAQPGQAVTVTGRLEVLYADPLDPMTGKSDVTFFIADTRDPRRKTQVVFDRNTALPPGGLFAARDKILTVSGIASSRLTARGAVINAQVVTASTSVTANFEGPTYASADLPQPTSGTTRWLNLRCKFREQTSDPPFNSTYFQTLMDHDFPNIGDYWSKVSYGTIDLGASYTTNWYQVFGNPVDYDGQTGHSDINGLLDECAVQAYVLESIDISQFYGVNVMLGEDLSNGTNCGEQVYTNIVGVNFGWHGITWIGQTGYASNDRRISVHHVLAHEEGHGYGFAHSASDFWDPMGFGACATGAQVPQPGQVLSPDPQQWTHTRLIVAPMQCVDVHQQGYNKVLAGWLSVGCHTGTFTLYLLDGPTSSGCQVATVPIGTSGTQFFTAEARRCGSCGGAMADGYEANVPGNAVIIRRWDLSAFSQSADISSPCGHTNPSCATNSFDPRDAMWTVGQTFEDPASNIGITVLSATTTSFTVFVGPPPSVTSISPTSGPTGGPSQPGAMVTVTGTNFTGATAVYFGDEQAADNNGNIGPGVGFTVLSDTTIQAQAPWSFGGNQAHVQVITTGGYSAISSVDVFTYHQTPTGTVDPGLAVTGVSPNTGPTSGGTAIQVTGTGFRGYDGQHNVSFLMADQFTFGPPRCTIVDDSHAKCTTAVDDYAETVHIVAVDTRGGWSQQTSADLFTYTGPARPTTPAVSGVTPFFGPTAGGNSVAITGGGFINPVGDVQFGNANTAAPYTVNSTTQVTATAPPPPAEYPGPPTVADVVVTTDAVFSSPLTAQDQYTFTNSGGLGPAAPVGPSTSTALPVITDISSHQGTSAGGERLIIRGTGFTGARSVRFGGSAAGQFSIDSDSQITVTTPAHPVGMVTVTVITGRESARRGVARFRFSQ